MPNPVTNVKKLWLAYRKDPCIKHRDALIGAYIHIVHSIGGKVTRNLPAHADQGSIIGLGVEGLIRAIEAYDATKGVRFEAYAKHRIKGQMLDHVRDSDWVPRLSRQRAKQLAHAQEARFLATGDRLHLDEVRGVHTGRADSVRIASVCCTSQLDLGDKGEDNGDLIHAAHGVTIDPVPAFEATDTDVGNVCKSLRGLDRAIHFYYHVMGLTMKQVGQVTRLTESWISYTFKGMKQRIRSAIVDRAHTL